MRQFALPADWEEGAPCVLSGGRARYLARVLRLAPGDSFPGIDAGGRRWLCELREIGSDRLVISVGPPPPEWKETAHLADVRPRGPSPRRARAAIGPSPELAAATPRAPEAGPRPDIVLVQGLPKLAKMDLIVRQAAESGVARVIPLLALRSAARAEAEVRGRCERWRRIVREALQQSGSAVPTRIDEPVGLNLLSTVLGESRGRRICLLLDAEAPCPGAEGTAGADLRGQTPNAAGARRALGALDSQSPPLALTSLHGYLTETPDEIVLCVGPEGGFAAEEARALAKAGFAPLRLPGAVLRTETAALFAVAAVEIILSERPSWIPRVP